MPRDSGGTFTLVSGNPVVSGTLIESNWANTTMPDLANGLSESLSRSGEGGMLAPLRGVNGSLGSPSISFLNDIYSGLSLAAVNSVLMQVGSQNSMRWTATGVEVWIDPAWVPLTTAADLDALLRLDATNWPDEFLRFSENWSAYDSSGQLMLYPSNPVTGSPAGAAAIRYTASVGSNVAKFELQADMSGPYFIANTHGVGGLGQLQLKQPTGLDYFDIRPSYAQFTYASGVPAVRYNSTQFQYFHTSGFPNLTASDVLFAYTQSGGSSSGFVYELGRFYVRDETGVIVFDTDVPVSTGNYNVSSNPLASISYDSSNHMLYQVLTNVGAITVTMLAPTAPYGDSITIDKGAGSGVVTIVGDAGITINVISGGTADITTDGQVGTLISLNATTWKFIK